MSRLIMEILTADDWVSYLVITDAVHEGSPVEVLRCLHQYSVGFGASTTLHGRCLGFLGGMRGEQLPTVVALFEPNKNVNECLSQGLVLTEYIVPPVADILAHFSGVAATSCMPGITMASCSDAGCS
jgi:hypothetical protein